MATRLYVIKNKAPNAIIHGPLRGVWNSAASNTQYSPVHETWRLSTSKGSDSLTDNYVNYRCNQQGNHDFASWVRFQTPPLEAQSISGTFNFCWALGVIWDTYTPPSQTNDSIVKWKVHVYLASGQSTTVKTTLLDNYINPTEFPDGSWPAKGLDSAQTLVSATAAAGDTIVIEIGFRIVSSPTPTPTYPPGQTTAIYWYSLGSNSTLPDATQGATLDNPYNYNGWFEFSNTLTFQAAPAASTNSTCATATEITTFPYTSAWIDTTEATSTPWKSAWFTFVAPTSGIIWFTNFGSNHETNINVKTGTCSALAPFTSISGTGVNTYTSHRSHTAIAINATMGTRYYVESYSQYGGSFRFQAFYTRTPLADDLYYPNIHILGLRDGVITNFTSIMADEGAMSGIAIDYSGRSMYDIEDGTHNISHRIVVNLFCCDLVEIIDLPTLGLGRSELDYIGHIFWDNETSHPGQLYITRAGFAHIGWMGNGFRYVSGIGTGFSAYLNSVSDDSELSKLRSVDLLKADNQNVDFADWPLDTETERLVSIDTAAPWCLTFNETTGIIYYTTGSMYTTLTPSNVINRYNTLTETQLTGWTVPLEGTLNVGLKGMDLLPDGGLLVCNGNRVTRLNSSGTVTQTYTPSLPEDCTTLMDVRLTVDKTKFWVVDLWSTRIWQFNVATGAELQTFQTYMNSGVGLQMAVYDPDGTTPPVPAPDISGIYYINPTKLTKHDSYYHDVEKKIPNPTVRTGLFGE